MKRDKFDDFIKNHRQVFDDIEPMPPSFKIEKKLVPVSNVRVLYALWAASVAVIMVLSFLLINKSNVSVEYAGLSINKNIFNVDVIDNIHIDDNMSESEISTNAQKLPKSIELNKNQPEENIIVEELFEADVYYSQEIKTKQNELILLTSSNPQIYQAVYADISELEKIYSELNKDLEDNIDNQQVVEAMIQNYRLRLTILEGVVQQIKNQSVNNNTQGYEF